MMRALDDIAREIRSNFALFEEGHLRLEWLAERQEALYADVRAAGKVDEVQTLVGDDVPQRAAVKIAKQQRDEWKALLARGETPRATPEGLAELDLIRRAGLTILVTKAGYALADAEMGR